MAEGVFITFEGGEGTEFDPSAQGGLTEQQGGVMQVIASRV